MTDEPLEADMTHHTLAAPLLTLPRDLEALGVAIAIDDTPDGRHGIVSLPATLGPLRRARALHLIQYSIYGGQFRQISVAIEGRRPRQFTVDTLTPTLNSAPAPIAALAALASAVGSTVTVLALEWELLLEHATPGHLIGNVPFIAWSLFVIAFAAFFAARAVTVAHRGATYGFAIAQRLRGHASPWLIVATIVATGVFVYPTDVFGGGDPAHPFVLLLRAGLMLTFVVLLFVRYTKLAEVATRMLEPAASPAIEREVVRSAITFALLALAAVVVPLVVAPLLPPL